MTPAGLERLKLDEGCELQAYPDPLSGSEPYTIGYGCTGADIGPGLVWTQAQANAALLTRVAQVESALTASLAPWFAVLQPVRQDVLTNIAYNIGVAGLLQWPETLAAAARGNYTEAAQDIAGNTLWVSQVGARAQRCANAMRTGSWNNAAAAPSFLSA
jgi:lysozyme